jgi:1-acyl-sn-glycerol-3-phosphate acyltransferase
MRCPIIPVVLTGTARTLPKHGLVLDTKADCHVQVMPPVDPASCGNGVEALLAYARSLTIA